MTDTVAVLGAGYAGTKAVAALQSLLDDETDLVWISDTDYHLVLHESHRIIRDPSVEEHIRIPIEDVTNSDTRFLEGRVESIDVENREIGLEDGETVAYDYALVAIGSRTAFYGIPGLSEYAHTLEGVVDALAIHEDLVDAAEAATPEEPAQVVVGGAGLSGIQVAGEIAEYRDEHDAAVEIHLVEALDEVFPGNPESVQQALRSRLEDIDVQIHTDDPITEATSERITFDNGSPLEHDVLIWTGGITGRHALAGAGIETEHERIVTEATFETSDERVFAVGDAALIEQNDSVAPPTAQAAWQAGDVAAKNLVRRMREEELRTWSFDDKGTVISIGERAVAHDVKLFPIETFGGFMAKTLKKFIAARWIASVTSWGRARRAWPVL